MSYDRTLVAQHALTVKEAHDFFRNRAHYTIHGDPREGFRVVYENLDTGVDFTFEFGFPDTLSGYREASRGRFGIRKPAILPEGGLDAKLRKILFNINLVRPRQFGLEAAPEIAVVQRKLGLRAPLDEDDLGAGTSLLDEDAFVAEWNSHNIASFRVLAQIQETEGSEEWQLGGHEVPSKFIDTLWRWNYACTDLERRLDAEIGELFTPSLTVFDIDGALERGVYWWKGEALVIPDLTDIVIAVPDRDRAAETMRIVYRAETEPFIAQFGRRIDGVDADILVYDDLATPPGEVQRFFEIVEGRRVDSINAIVPFRELIDADLLAETRASFSRQ